MKGCKLCYAYPGFVSVEGTLFRCSCPLGADAKLYEDKNKERPIEIGRLPGAHPPAPSGRERAAGEKEED